MVFRMTGTAPEQGIRLSMFRSLHESSAEFKRPHARIPFSTRGLQVPLTGISPAFRLQLAETRNSAAGV